VSDECEMITVLEKLVVAHIVRKFPTFNEIEKCHVILTVHTVVMINTNTEWTVITAKNV
jgi:hypothetical protein